MSFTTTLVLRSDAANRAALMSPFRPNRPPKLSARICGLKMCLFGTKGRKGRRQQTLAAPGPEMQQAPEPEPHVLVLIMLDCEDNAFNNFIAQLPNKGASHNQRYEQPGLHLRGYKTALDVQYARGLRESQVGKDAGLLGIAYLGRVLPDPPSFQVSSGHKPARQAQQGQNVGLGSLWHLEAVDASPSHSAGRGVNVYVMDTGINEFHAVSC